MGNYETKLHTVQLLIRPFGYISGYAKIQNSTSILSLPLIYQLIELNEL